MKNNKKSLFGILFFFIFSIFIFNTSNANDLISYIDVGFCNSKDQSIQKDTNISLIPGIEDEICIQIKNNLNATVYLKLEFVQGIVTNDNYKNKACDISAGNFGKYITPSWGKEIITVNSNSTVQKKAKIKFPLGMNGIQHGCLVYYINDIGKSQEMFNIIVRKANFIDVFLDDNVDIKNLIELKNIQSKSLSSNKKIRTYNDSEGNLYLEFTVLNNSIIDENIAVTGNISDYFGFNKDFNLEQKTIYSDSESHFTINLGKLPNYKGIFNINFNLIYKPDFKFSTDGINKDILQGGTLNEEFNLFLMPWKLIIGIIIVLIFIKVLFRSGKKYRQKNT